MHVVSSPLYGAFEEDDGELVLRLTPAEASEIRGIVYEFLGEGRTWNPPQVTDPVLDRKAIRHSVIRKLGVSDRDLTREFLTSLSDGRHVAQCPRCQSEEFELLYEVRFTDRPRGLERQGEDGKVRWPHFNPDDGRHRDVDSAQVVHVSCADFTCDWESDVESPEHHPGHPFRWRVT